MMRYQGSFCNQAMDNGLEYAANEPRSGPSLFPMACQ